jgi:hypothetical protein
VGIDLRTPVDDKDYQVPFKFTGKLNKLTINLGPPQIAETDKQAVQEHMLSASN